MSSSVKIADEITKWDGYALFDKDNVLLNDQMFIRLDEARSIASRYQDGEAIVWRIELDRKEKINDNHSK